MKIGKNVERKFKKKMWRFTFLVLLWCPGSKSGSNIFMKKGGKKNTLCMRKTANNHGTFFQLTAKSGFSQKSRKYKMMKKTGNHPIPFLNS